MKVTKKQLQEMRERYKNDYAFKKMIQRYYSQYYAVPFPDLEVECTGIGKLWMEKQRFPRKRTFCFELADGSKGDVWHNRSKFIVKVDGQPVSKDVFDVVKDLTVIGYFGMQVLLEEEDMKKNEFKAD